MKRVIFAVIAGFLVCGVDWSYNQYVAGWETLPQVSSPLHAQTAPAVPGDYTVEPPSLIRARSTAHPYFWIDDVNLYVEPPKLKHETEYVIGGVTYWETAELSGTATTDTSTDGAVGMMGSPILRTPEEDRLPWEALSVLNEDPGSIDDFTLCWRRGRPVLCEEMR